MLDIKLIIYDFDGVLTDNRVLVCQDGKESVFCNRSDGLWINEIKNKKIEQLILSTEKNPVVLVRADKIGIATLHGVQNKKKALLKILEKKKLAIEQVIYVGNDMNDFECMHYLTHTFCPCDAHPKIQEISHILPVKGGDGIVRHIYDWIKNQTNLFSCPPSTTTFEPVI